MYLEGPVFEILFFLVVFHEPSLFTFASDSKDTTKDVLTTNTEGPKTALSKTTTLPTTKTPLLTTTKTTAPTTTEKTTPTTTHKPVPVPNQPTTVPGTISTTHKPTGTGYVKTEERSPDKNAGDKSLSGRAQEEWIMWVIVVVSVVYTALVVTIVALKLFASRALKKRQLKGNNEEMKTKTDQLSALEDRKDLEVQLDNKENTSGSSKATPRAALEEGAVNTEEPLKTPKTPGPDSTASMDEGYLSNEQKTNIDLSTLEKSEGNQLQTSQAETVVINPSANSEEVETTSYEYEVKAVENQSWSTSLLGNVLQDKGLNEKVSDVTDTTYPPPPSPTEMSTSLVTNVTIENVPLSSPSVQLEDTTPTSNQGIQDRESATQSTNL